MTPRAVIGYRIADKKLVRTLDCGHVQRVTAPPKVDLRTLPRTAPTCPECDRLTTEPTPPKAA